MMRHKAWVLAAVCFLSSVGHAGTEEAKASYMRGAALEKNGQYQEAIAEYDAALLAEPRYAYAHKQLGNCYYRLGDKAKALTHYDAYLSAVPNDAATAQFASRLRASVGTPQAAAAAKPAGKSNAIYTNPIAIALSTINLGYTRAFGTHNALIVEGAFSSLNLGSTSYSMMGGGLGWHFTSRQLEGWFIGPKVQYFVVDVSQTSGTVKATAKGTAISYGGEGGYQWVWDSGVFLNLGLGASMTTIAVDANASSGGAKVTASASFSGVIPTGLLNLGFAF